MHNAGLDEDSSMYPWLKNCDDQEEAIRSHNTTQTASDSLTKT